MASNPDLLGKGLVNLSVTSSSGSCACDTKQIKGEASKDSLYGTNQTVEYSTSMSIEKTAGKLGGRPLFGN